MATHFTRSVSFPERRMVPVPDQYPVISSIGPACAVAGRIASNVRPTAAAARRVMQLPSHRPRTTLAESFRRSNRVLSNAVIPASAQRVRGNLPCRLSSGFGVVAWLLGCQDGVDDDHELAHDGGGGDEEGIAARDDALSEVAQMRTVADGG